jgi:hypothetical protein
MWWKGSGKGGLIHFGAADIFTLISTARTNMYFGIRGPNFVKSTY